MSGVTRYHPALVVVHWAMAVLILADLALGTAKLAHIPNDSPEKVNALLKHGSAGLLILLMMLTRILLRAKTERPAPASTGSRFLDRLAWVSHRAFYVAIVGMLVSGIGMAVQVHLVDVIVSQGGHLPETFWAFPLRYVHYFFSRVLLGLVALHVAAVLYHTIFKRDRLLTRMSLGPRTVAKQAVSALER